MTEKEREREREREREGERKRGKEREREREGEREKIAFSADSTSCIMRGTQPKVEGRERGTEGGWLWPLASSP